MGETWGISGPAFLVGYLALAALGWLATAWARRALAGGPDRPEPGPGRPHDLAYLNGGADLAVTSALTAMHLKGTIVPSRGQIRAVGRLEPGADALERAIHFATGTSTARKQLAAARPVRTALDAMHKRLVAEGLLLSEPRRRRIRAAGWWMIGIIAVGLLRLLAGVADGRPVGFLVVALICVTAATLVHLLHAPRRSRAGDRLLARLRTEHHALSPKQHPDWVAYGPAAAALGVGVFGASALWASDPALAEELELQRAAGGGDGGSSTFVGGGGDTGGGGGDGGGGGGGGCGGGGCGG